MSSTFTPGKSYMDYKRISNLQQLLSYQNTKQRWKYSVHHQCEEKYVLPPIKTSTKIHFNRSPNLIPKWSLKLTLKNAALNVTIQNNDLGASILGSYFILLLPPTGILKLSHSDCAKVKVGQLAKQLFFS